MAELGTSSARGAGLACSDALFRQAMAAAGDAVLITEAETRAPGPVIRFANAAMASLTGYAIEELVGATPRILQGPETDPATIDGLRAALREVRSFTGESVNYRKDGSAYFVEWVIDPIFDEAGLLTGWLSVQRDVTERRNAEKRLQRSEDRLRAIFDSASVGLSVIDAGGRFRRVNGELCRILGRSREAVLELGVADVTVPDDLPPSRAALQKAAATGRSMGLDKRYRRPGGEIVWANSVITPLTDDEDAAGTMLVVTMDLTDRKQAEDAVRASEERLRGAFALETVGIVFWDDEFRIAEVNDAFLRMTGLSREEAIGTAWSDLTPDDHWPASLAAINQIARHGETVPYEKQYLRGDGTRWWGLFAARKVGPHVIEFVIDVSDRVRAEQALRHSDDRFRQFAGATADVLWIRDAGTLRFDYASPAFERLYGLPVQRVVGSGSLRAWARLVLPQDRRAALDAVRLARTGQTTSTLFRIRRPSDGQVRWVRDTSFPIEDESGRMHRIGGISEDATEARESSARLQVLIAELQHRTRNLIGVIRALSRRTLEGSATLGDFEARFNDRLSALGRVNGLLSRLEEGNRITFDELIGSELDSLGANLPIGGGRITLDGPRDLRLRSGTVQTFALALHELATNAVKYGALSDKGGHLTVRWHLEDGRTTAPMLHVIWRESGVATTRADGAPDGGGYGRELIERVLPYQLGALTAFDLGPDGICCTIALPVSAHGAG